MKTISYELPESLSALMVAKWCHENRIPVIIKYPTGKGYDWLGVDHKDIIWTSREVVRQSSTIQILDAVLRSFAIVREEDYALLRCRF